MWPGVSPRSACSLDWQSWKHFRALLCERCWPFLDGVGDYVGRIIWFTLPVGYDGGFQLNLESKVVVLAEELLGRLEGLGYQYGGPVDVAQVAYRMRQVHLGSDGKAECVIAAKRPSERQRFRGELRAIR